MKVNSQKIFKSCLSVSLALLLTVLPISSYATNKDIVPNRNEVESKYKWDVDKLFDSRASFEAELKRIETQLIPKIDQYRGKLNNIESFKAYSKLTDEIEIALYKVYGYASMISDIESTNNDYSERLQLAESLYYTYMEKTSFVLPELSSMDEASFNKLESDSSLKDYKRMLDIIQANKKHILSEKEEALLAQLGELISAPGTLHSKITLSDYEIPVIVDKNGNEIELTDEKYYKILESDDRELRKQAFEAITSSYKKNNHALAANYSNNVKANVINAQIRNHDSALSSILFSEEIPESIYQNFVSSVNKNLAPLHKYNEIKKKHFGFEEMYAYDTSLPLNEDSKTRYTYDEAVDIIRKALSPLGEKYVSDFKNAINSNWIDVYPSKDKYTGAYSYGSYTTKPYILLNYDNTLDGLLTLAHEMGHSMNSKYSNETQNYPTSEYPIFTAEVSSTLNELLVMDYLIKNAKTDDEKLYLLNKQINNIRGTVYSQVMFAEFEQIAHETVENGQPLSPDLLNSTWLELTKKYNGPAITTLDNSQYYWSWIPHFYSSFYVYKYATSMSAAYSILNKINGPSSDKAVENYLQFLAIGGSVPPVDALKIAGVDMNSSEPVNGLLAYFNTLVNQYESILTKN